MEKAKEHNKESNNNSNNNGKKRFHRHKHHQRNHKKETAPTWDFEKKGAELPETKADLMMILEEVNPEELLMVSLVKQNKELKLIKKVEQEEVNTDMDTSLESTESTEPTEKVKINLSRNCPICEKPIREIMYALHDYDHDQLAHFDCVYKKVLVSVKEKLIDKRYLAYLGSGSFGIMDPGNGNKQRITLIEKIYPGAPLEELLHGDENIKDEEL